MYGRIGMSAPEAKNAKLDRDALHAEPISAKESEWSTGPWEPSGRAENFGLQSHVR